MEKSIRVAMIIHRYYPHIGGAERVLAALSPVLQSKGIDVHILTRNSPGLPSFERIAGVPIHRLPATGPKAFASLRFTLAALRMVHRLRPDIVHAHIMFSPATIAVLAKRLFGTPFVITVHRSGPAPFGEIARLRQKFFGKQRLSIIRQYTDRFVVISREIERELDAVGVPATRRAIISNAVDSSCLAPLPPEKKRAMRQKMGIPDVPVAVFTGRLSREKRVHHLLTIWPAIRRIHPEALLLVVGDGPEAAALRQAAGDGIRFTGGVTDVRHYLQVADLFVLPSVAEGFSIALLEAMATALPVIVTRLAGALDLITHGENGRLIPPDDVPALQDAVLTLFNDPDLSNNIGCRAREHVENHYSLPVIVEQLRNLYKQLMMGKNGQDISMQPK